MKIQTPLVVHAALTFINADFKCWMDSMNIGTNRIYVKHPWKPDMKHTQIFMNYDLNKV